MTYREVLKVAQAKCEQYDIPSQHALLLLLGISDMEAHNLYEEYESEIPNDIHMKYEDALSRLYAQEPLAHILGYEYFYGYQFKVNEDVLIPRPETEELVANVLAAYDEHFHRQKVTLIDVGCGSGAISISLAKEESNFTVYASDISEKAIVVAKENTKTLEANVNFFVGDMLQPFIDQNMKVDILVSNPPYIPQEEVMEKSVVDFEPHVALFGGEDGLYFYRMIFERAHLLLKDKAILAFEMGYDQKEAMEQEARKYFPHAKMETIKDLQGKNRMFFIYYEKETRN